MVVFPVLDKTSQLLRDSVAVIETAGMFLISVVAASDDNVLPSTTSRNCPLPPKR